MKTKVSIALVAKSIMVTGDLTIEGELHSSQEQVEKWINEAIENTLVGTYTIYISRVSGNGLPSKIQAIKEVRRFTGWGLKVAKDIIVGVESDSVVIPIEMRMIEAEELARRLRDCYYDARAIPKKFALFAKRGTIT